MNAEKVLAGLYLRRNEGGEVIETFDEMKHRVADAVAVNEDTPVYWAGEFYRLMRDGDFYPNSPTLMNAGNGAGTLSGCFVLPLDDSMDGIMETARQVALVQKFGGGTGVALTRLRAKGAPIASTHGSACGPVAVLKHLSSVSTMITQGGKRDGANMAIMRWDHPDILDFVRCKATEGDIHNYNISVAVDDLFIQQVKMRVPAVVELWGAIVRAASSRCCHLSRVRWVPSTWRTSCGRRSSEQTVTLVVSLQRGKSIGSVLRPPSAPPCASSTT